MFLRVRLASLSLHVGFFFVSVSGYCVKLLRLLVLVAQLCRGPGLRGVQLQARFSPQPVPPPDVVTVSKKATDAICTVLTATSRGRARNQGQLLPVRGSGLLSKGHRAHRGHHRMWRGQGHTSGGQSVRERSGPSDLCCYPVGRHQRRRAGCRRPAKTPAVPSASARDAYHSASPGMSLVAPRSSHPSAAAQSEESVTANVRSRPRALRRTACACRRPAGPAASPPAPSGLASRVSPRPRAALPAVRSAVWSQGRRRKRPRLSLPPRGAILTGAAAPRAAVLARAPCQRSVAQRAVMSLHAVQSGRVCAAGLAVFPVFRILRPWPRVGSSLSPAYCFLCQTKS